MWIQNDNRHPFAINIIDMFLDPNIYFISATRLKTHNCVVATLALKNIVMASPINHYKQKQAKGRNEKPKMHSGRFRGLSYNMFLLATNDHGNMRGRHQAYAATFLGMLNTYIGLGLNGVVELDDQLVIQAVHQFMHGIFS